MGLNNLYDSVSLRLLVVLWNLKYTSFLWSFDKNTKYVSNESKYRLTVLYTGLGCK